MINHLSIQFDIFQICSQCPSENFSSTTFIISFLFIDFVYLFLLKLVVVNQCYSLLSSKQKLICKPTSLPNIMSFKGLPFLSSILHKLHALFCTPHHQIAAKYDFTFLFINIYWLFFMVQLQEEELALPQPFLSKEFQSQYQHLAPSSQRLQQL